jgi:tetratricopeptide (TPR) repeat protein
MYREEEKEYQKCLRIDPRDPYVHYNLAILYDDKLNRNDKAIVHYRKYLDLHPSGEGVVQVKEWLLHAEQELRLGTQSH